MSVRNNVVLTFNSDVGGIVRLSIPRADLTLDAARVETAMEGMIQGGIVLTSAGFPISIHGAKIVTTERTPLVNI